MGLCTFGDPERPALKRGIEYLVRTQNTDGSWSEDETTGTGFPKVFYLKYDMYRNNWPLLALATYQKIRANPARDETLRQSDREPVGSGQAVSAAAAPTVAMS